MRTDVYTGRQILAAVALLVVCESAEAQRLWVKDVYPQPGPSATETSNVWVKQVKGRETFEGPLTKNSALYEVQDGEFLRYLSVITTPRNGHAVLMTPLTGAAGLRLESNGHFVINPTIQGLDLLVEKGRLLFSKRGREFLLQLRTGHVVASSPGTEYAIEVTETNTVITLFEGNLNISEPKDANVRFSRAFTNSLASEPLRIHVTTDGIQEGKGQLVQWWLYYPSVLVPEELPPQLALNLDYVGPLEAYRRGNIGAAQSLLPNNPDLSIPGSRELVAALRIAAGASDAADSLLTVPEVDLRLRNALTALVAAIAGQGLNVDVPTTASEFLARSWWRQAHWNIPAALEDARQAQAISGSAFVFARIAQLEFVCGNLAAARKASDAALAKAPEMAAALAVRGFLSAAENRLEEAEHWFERAMAVDPRLGDAWFGRGLVRYRRGCWNEALEDLRVAVNRQRDRALFRAYLGRMGTASGRTEVGLEELMLALELDGNDPTGWWFLAIDHFQRNRINEAVEFLDRALERNDLRAVQRSRRLLEADRALRQANLARIYERAGLPELALSQAAEAVVADPASHSAHLFLADCFNALRDLTRFQTRYDTLWLSELLLANLHAPVGVGPLNINISQDEYSRLLDREGFRFSSLSEMRSDGQFREVATQSAVYRNSAYALDLDWQHNDPKAYRRELDRWEGFAQIKQQLGLQDTAILFFQWGNFSAGDNFQRYDPTTTLQNVVYREWQRPNSLGLWRHEWSSQNQTLALVGRLTNEQEIEAQSITDQEWRVSGASPPLRSLETIDDIYRADFETYVGELAQVFQSVNHAVNIGARFNEGDFDAESQINVQRAATNLTTALVGQRFSRLGLYAYERWRIRDDLSLIGGLTYDRVEAPANFRRQPLGPGTHEESALMPKVGLLWRPCKPVAVRGLYAQSLTGVSFDDSFRLEPVELAGFPQAYRNIMPASEVGPVEGHRLETYGAALDLFFTPRAFAGIMLNAGHSDVERQTGAIMRDNPPNTSVHFSSVQIHERLDYDEQGVAAWYGQLVGEDAYWRIHFGVKQAELDSALTEFKNERHREAFLYRIGLRVGMNLPSGWFWRVDSRWYWQKSFGALAPNTWADDNFERTDLLFGWRFPKQRGELATGIYNLSGRDYRLDPLNQEPEFARERAIFVRLRFEL